MPSSRVMKYNGTAWEPFYGVKMYNGTSWVDFSNFKRYDGTAWTQMIDRTPDTQQYTLTKTSTDMASYNSSGSIKGTDYAYQGYFSSVHGEQKAIYMFDHAAIRAALAGSVIDDVDVKLTAVHTYSGGGSTFYVGTNNSSSIPSTYSTVATGLGSALIAAGGSATIDLPNSVGQQFRDNTVKALVLDAPGTSLSYYGYCAPTCTLTIKYTK